MSRLDELITGLCPEGIEFVKLSEVFDIKNGYTPAKSNDEFWQNGTVPWFRMEDIRQKGGILSDSLQHISPEAVKGKLMPAGSVIIATSATIGIHALISVESLANQRFTYLTRKSEFIDRLDPLFIYYYCFKLDEWCLNNTNISSFASVDMEKFQRFPFPIPPLPVQQEIVRILDTFTELTTELTAELTARKKQYQYYRDLLLTFDDANSTIQTDRQTDRQTRWITLGEIGRVAMCKRIMKSETSAEGDVPFYKIGTFGKTPDAYISSDLYEQYKRNYSYPEKGDVLISAAGTIGRTVIYDGEPAYYQDSNIVWLQHDESQALNRYLFYCYQLSPWNISTGGTIARLYNDNITKARIPLPSLAEQTRIVSILDRFDTLCNDLTSGLPAEIEARRKQYEYYRDTLLTFQEKVAI